MRTAISLVAALALSCGASSPAPGPPPHPSAAPAASAPSAEAPAASASAEAEPPSRPLPDVHIVNQCHEVAILAYGDPPNMKPGDLGRLVGDGGEGRAPRERDGTLPVALVTEKGEVLAQVRVSRRMKRLEIGRSCRTLYAH